MYANLRKGENSKKFTKRSRLFLRSFFELHTCIDGEFGGGVLDG